MTENQQKLKRVETTITHLVCGEGIVTLPMIESRDRYRTLTGQQYDAINERFLPWTENDE